MRFALLVIALAGCGDNQDPCGYHEASDAANASAPETTPLAVSGGAIGLCGSVDGGHYDPAAGTVDVDSYRVSVGGTGELLVQLTADPEVALLGELAVRLFTAAPNPTLLAQGTLRPELADHGAFVATVPPGDIVVVVTARASTGVIGSLPYRVRIEGAPSTLCPATLGPVQYREAHAGDNDVVAVDLAHAPAFRAMAGQPEHTDLDIEGSHPFHIAGNADVAPRGDAYLDRDTYELRAGAGIDELGVRLAWSGGADLDFVVFEADTLVPVATSARSTGNAELQIFAVRPNQRYWLWVGRYAEPAGTAAIAYDANVCANAFY